MLSMEKIEIILSAEVKEMFREYCDRNGFTMAGLLKQHIYSLVKPSEPVVSLPLNSDEFAQFDAYCRARGAGSAEQRLAQIIRASINSIKLG